MTEEVAWVKWHFAKWRGDPALRMCSLATRGLWADLLAVMHECSPYGHLIIGECAPSARRVAMLVGASEKQVASCVAELIKNRVCGVTKEGVIFSRRMVRDKENRDEGRKNGSKGGNPKLKNGHAHESADGVNPHDGDEGLDRERNREREREREENSLRSPRAREGGDGDNPEVEFDATFWPAYPRKDDKGHARKAFKSARRKVSLEVVMTGLASYEFSPERRLQPLPATWLNGERWDDQRLDLPQSSNGHDQTDRWGLNAWITKQNDVKDGFVKGEPRKMINGLAVDHYAVRIAEAAGLPESWRGNWDSLGRWLRDSLGMIDEPPVLDAVRNQAGRMNGGVGSIGVFDAALRAAAARCRGTR